MKITIGIFVFLLINSITDWRTRKIWMCSVWAAVPYFLYCLWEAGQPLGIHLLCGVITGLGILLLSTLTEGQIGRGDGVVMGSIMLAAGLWEGIVCIFLGMAYAFLMAVVLVVFCHKKRDYRMPFVPFLMLGYVTCMLGRWL